MKLFGNDPSRFRIVKKTHGDGSVLFVVQMGTDHSINDCPHWSNFVDIGTRVTIEDAREARDFLVGRQIVSEEVVE